MKQSVLDTKDSYRFSSYSIVVPLDSEPGATYHIYNTRTNKINIRALWK